jgi:hypothetical protein
MPAVREIKEGFYWSLGLLAAFFVVSRLLTFLGLKEHVHVDADTVIGG